MPDALANLAHSLFGDLDTSLNSMQMTLRAVLTFAVTLIAIRLGNKRLFGKGTTFDTVIAIMIGSVMSRAITGSGAGSMIATWVAGFVLIALHWALSWLAYHFDSFGPAVKGNEVRLVKDGGVLEDGMRETSTTIRDLKRAIRQSGSEADISGVQTAYMERDGEISVIPASSGPKVLEVRVEQGVQTVRIALE